MIVHSPTVTTDAIYKCFLAAKTAQEREMWRQTLLSVIPKASEMCGCNLKYDGVNR